MEALSRDGRVTISGGTRGFFLGVLAAAVATLLALGLTYSLSPGLRDKVLSLTPLAWVFFYAVQTGVKDLLLLDGLTRLEADRKCIVEVFFGETRSGYLYKMRPQQATPATTLGNPR